jgi:hypothetical protein
MNKEKLIHEIGSKIIEDIGSRKKNWTHLVLVGTVKRTGEPEMTGFAYFGDGKHAPAAPRDFDILELLDELREAMAVSDKTSPWLTSLIRIERETGEITIDFEYDDADRWEIDLENTDQRARELAPKTR